MTRKMLGLTQEEFAARFHIPLGAAGLPGGASRGPGAPLANTQQLAEAPSLFIEAPPILERVTAAEPPQLRRLIQKFDPAARDERNRALGKAGEERVFFSERSRLANEGRADLARQVRWVSQEDGDGAGA
jgi:hypothetical protein